MLGLADPVMLQLLAVAAAQAASKQTSLFLVHLLLLRIGSASAMMLAGPSEPKVEAWPVAGFTLTPRRGHSLFGITPGIFIQAGSSLFGARSSIPILAVYLKAEERLSHKPRVGCSLFFFFFSSGEPYENKTSSFHQCGNWSRAQQFVMAYIFKDKFTAEPMYLY